MSVTPSSPAPDGTGSRGTTPAQSISEILPLDRKRKRDFLDGPTPGTPNSDNVPLAADTAPATTKPRLTVSRPPVFVPCPDDPDYNTTDQIAINRLGFRYIPAGLSAPGSKIPYRTIESNPQGYVRVSWEDRSPFVKVTTDGLGLKGEKGYRSARCNVPVREGRWYMEIEILEGGGEKPPESSRTEGAHVRLGWARREANLNGPVGLDGYSYAYGDKAGHKITLSRPRPYGEKFGSGDVIGMYISLPRRREANPRDQYDPAQIKRERIPIEFKGQEYFEMVEYPQSKEMMALLDLSDKSRSTASLPPTKKSATVKNLNDRGRNNLLPEPAPLRPLPTLPGSRLAFFVNGKSQGIAFQDVYDYLQLRSTNSSRKNQSKRKLREGTVEHKENPFDDGTLGYYPFISLFNGARVRLNPGPDFKFPPPADIDSLLQDGPNAADTQAQNWRPLSERYAEFMAEQWELDAQDESKIQAQSQVQTHQDDAEAKLAHRRERRRVAERERRARKAAEARAQKARDSEGPSTGTPLRFVDERLASLAALLDDSPKLSQSPPPTIASSDDPAFRGGTSGWNSGEESDTDRIRMDIQALQKVEENELDAYDLLEHLAG